MDVKSLNANQETPVSDWYLFKNCDKFGPLTAKEISELLDKNQINKDHHVWHQKYNSWLVIKDIDVFQSVGFELQESKKEVNFVETSTSEIIAPVTESQEQKGFFSKILAYFK